MNILLLAPVHDEISFLQDKKRYEFPKNQLQQAWVEALQQLGHKVKVIRYTESSILPLYVKAQIEFFAKSHVPTLRSKIQKVQDKIYRFSLDNQIKNLLIKKNTYSFKPNLVFISGGAFCVFPKTIQEIKDAFNAPVVLISGVNPTHGSPKAEKEIVASGIVDLVIANDKGFAKNWEKLGAKEVVSLPISAANIHLWKKVMLSKKEQEIYHSDICFIGSLTADRQEILKTLTGYNLKIWGSIPTGTKLLHGLKPYYYGTAAGEKAVKIFNSAKIVLNLHVEEMKYGGNLRTFEIPASGAFQMVDRYDSAWFKEGKEIVIFHGNKDLRKKIEFYLRYEKERKKIALAGYKRVLKDHVYAKRFKTILAIVKTL